MSLRIIFMGTPDFSVPILSALLDAGHHLVCSYSQPPRPAGRGQLERPSPVQAFAESRNVPVRTPKSLRNAEAQADFAALAADVAVVAAYGLILPKPILEGATLRLPQCSCLAVAALARRRADPSGHPGRRRPVGRDHHANG